MRRVAILAALAVAGAVLFGGEFLVNDRTRALQELESNPFLAQDVFDPLQAQGASRPYRELVALVRGGGVPEADELAGLGSDLERAYGIRPRPVLDSVEYQRQITLLDHALMSGNLPATTAILQAGHNPNLAGAEFAKAAAPAPSGPPDWSTSPPFLQAYLDHGGNPDYPSDNTARPMISMAAAVGNYEGVKFLLSNGADPWIEVRGTGWPDNPPPASLRVRAVPDMLKGGPAQLDLFIWLHEAGIMQAAPPAMQALVYDDFLGDVDWLISRQNTLGDDRTAQIRDGLAASLGQDIDYRREDRVRAVDRLSAYLQEREDRP